MKIRARLHNERARNDVELETDGRSHSIVVPPKPSGAGSDVNGGELLVLALATCYCNDVYREAAKLGVDVASVDVTVEGEFRGPGEPAANITYRARIASSASADQVRDLLAHVDTVAEIHNTVRAGTPVALDLSNETATDPDAIRPLRSE